MELRQLRSLITLADADFGVSRAAQRLHLVQSAVSQHIRQLETAVGTPLFERQGKRLLGLTETGRLVLHHARRTLAEADNILAVGRDLTEADRGVLRVGVTHTQARYVLPPVIREFAGQYPDVALQLHQGTPSQLVDLALSDKVDLAICTEALDQNPALVTIPCYRWNRCVIAPHGHRVLGQRPLTLEKLCDYPIITYVFGFTGGGHLRAAFAKLGLQPRVVLSAADTDVIKTYVREGMGIGILACLAHSPVHDSDLGIQDLSHLFPWEIAKIAYRKDKYLRTYQRDFIDRFQALTAQAYGDALAARRRGLGGARPI